MSTTFSFFTRLQIVFLAIVSPKQLFTAITGVGDDEVKMLVNMHNKGRDEQLEQVIEWLEINCSYSNNYLYLDDEEINKYQFPLVIIDSLSSMMEPTGIEENTSRYAQPIRSAINQLRKTGATLLIIIIQ